MAKIGRPQKSHESRTLDTFLRINEYKETIHIDVFYPEHPPRKPTALYAKNHRMMCIEEDQPCYICGVRNSTLGDPAKNTWKAKALETHHWIIEDSLAEVVDLVKFNERIVHWWRNLPNHDPQFDHDFTQEEMIEWVHGSRWNLRVLCDIHHRSKICGIHHLPYPFWSVMDILQPDFKFMLETPVLGGK